MTVRRPDAGPGDAPGPGRCRATQPAPALALAAALSVAGCATTPETPAAPTARLAAYMKGGFVAADPDGGDGNVRLRIEPVHVERWDLREGIRLFVALQPEADGPWLQALYRLVPADDGRVVVESWRFRDETFNVTPEPTVLGRIERKTLDAFRHRRGCDIAFELQADGEFLGEHDPRGACRNTLQGADYVWARKTVGPNRMEWWVRGYTDDGEVVWGPESGGWLLERRSR